MEVCTVCEAHVWRELRAHGSPARWLPSAGWVCWAWKQWPELTASLRTPPPQNTPAPEGYQLRPTVKLARSDIQTTHTGEQIEWAHIEMCFCMCVCLYLCLSTCTLLLPTAVARLQRRPLPSPSPSPTNTASRLSIRAWKVLSFTRWSNTPSNTATNTQVMCIHRWYPYVHRKNENTWTETETQRKTHK